MATFNFFSLWCFLKRVKLETSPDTDKWIVVELTKLEETCKKYERKDRAEIAIFNDMFSEFVLEASGYKLVEGKGV